MSRFGTQLLLLHAERLTLAVTGVLILTGCGKPAESMPAPASLETHAEELRQLKTIPHVTAEGFTGPGGHPFFVKDRLPHLQQFPCSSCHDQPLPVAVEHPLVVVRTMHTDIILQHAGPEVMDCRTCHDEKSLDQLRTGKGQAVPMNQAQQLCVQCHFQQADDWAGGAHGKRLAGWRGKRVVTSCTECHDPHHPAIGKEWPVTFPLLPHAKVKHADAGGHHD